MHNYKITYKVNNNTKTIMRVLVLFSAYLLVCCQMKEEGNFTIVLHIYISSYIFLSGSDSRNVHNINPRNSKEVRGKAKRAPGINDCSYMFFYVNFFFFIYRFFFSIYRVF